MFLSSRGASSGSIAPRKAWNADGVAAQALQLVNARARGLAEQLLGCRVAFEAGLQQVVGEGQHAAPCVVDQDELVGVEQVVRDDQAADRVVADHAAGVADDVRISGLQAEQALDVQARVHAGHDGHSLGRLDRLLAGVGRLVQGLAARVLLVVLQVVVGHRLGHGASLG